MQIDISNLKTALSNLEEGINILNTNTDSRLTLVLEDACIQRFEYTLEIARKLMKKILKKIYGKNEEELTVNNVFRFFEGYNFISDWQNWRGYWEKRNSTSHEYNLEKSRKLLDIIPDFIKDTKELTNNLEKLC